MPAWLGSGWPEWVAVGGNPEQYNQDINSFQSVLSLAFIAASFLAGAWVDFCAKKFNGEEGTRFGEMVGLVSCFSGAQT